MENHLAKPRMTCQEYIDSLNDSYEFDAIFDEMYWSDDYSDKVLWNYVLTKAFINNIILTDILEYDYETEFWELYQAAEKGLS